MQQKHQKVNTLFQYILLKFGATHAGGHWTCREPLCFAESSEQNKKYVGGIAPLKLNTKITWLIINAAGHYCQNE